MCPRPNLSVRYKTILRKGSPGATTLAFANGFKIKVVLFGGKSIVGLLAGTSTDNNAGEGGFWATCGDLSVKDEKGHTHVIDRLHIEKVEAP